MSPDDPLAAEMEAARRRKQAAERAAAERAAAEARKQAELEAEAERRRRELQTVGASFIRRARAAGIRPSRVQVQVGRRDRYEGFFNRRKVGTEAVYEAHDAWTVVPYHHGSGYSSDPARNGIYVLEDGRIIGSMNDIKTLPEESVEQVTQIVADFLVAKGAR